MLAIHHCLRAPLLAIPTAHRPPHQPTPPRSLPPHCYTTPPPVPPYRCGAAHSGIVGATRGTGGVPSPSAGSWSAVPAQPTDAITHAHITITNTGDAKKNPKQMQKLHVQKCGGFPGTGNPDNMNSNNNYMRMNTQYEHAHTARIRAHPAVRCHLLEFMPHGRHVLRRITPTARVVVVVPFRASVRTAEPPPTGRPPTPGPIPSTQHLQARAWHWDTAR